MKGLESGDDKIEARGGAGFLDMEMTHGVESVIILSLMLWNSLIVIRYACDLMWDCNK